MNQNKTGCKSCDEGVLDAAMLDENGVLCSITGKAGTLCHAYEDMWWPCENKKLIKEIAKPTYWTREDQWGIRVCSDTGDLAFFKNDRDAAERVLSLLNRLEELKKANEKLIWKPVADGIKSENDLFMIRLNRETCCSHVGLRVGEYYQIDEIKNKRKGVYFGQWDLEDILNEYPDAEWREIVEAI